MGRGRRRAGWGLALVLAAFAAGTPAAHARELVVVQANVGNVNVPGCQAQVFKLCLRPVEARAATALRALRPDLVAFQEILPPDLCERAPSANPANLCSGPLAPPSQVERLLGPGYDVACDGRFGWDCLAVARRTAALEAWETRPVVPQCRDTGFTLNTAAMRVDGWPVTITSAHPDSMNAGCRAAQLADFFATALPARGPAVVMGDFNLDPFREDDASVRYWRTQVPARFALASTSELTSFPCEPSQLDPTGTVIDGEVRACVGPLAPRTIDHVLVRDGASGTCRVQRVDGGGGMDHRAQVCRVQLGPEVTPRLRLRQRGCAVTASFEPARPDLSGVRLRLGARTVESTRPPHRVQLRGAERRRGAVFTVTARLAGADGPAVSRRVRACAARRPAPPRRPPLAPRRGPRFTG